MEYFVAFLLLALMSIIPISGNLISSWLSRRTCGRFARCISGSGAGDNPDLESSSTTFVESVTERQSDSISSKFKEKSVHVAPIRSASQSWLPDTSAADSGSGASDSPGLGPSSPFLGSVTERNSHLMSSSEFIENSVHGVPKKSKLPESSTTHHETSIYKKQSTTPISEAPFETLSDSDIPVDPEKTFQTDTLEYIDDSLSPSPEYILMDKTYVHVQAYKSSLFPLIQTSHDMSVGDVDTMTPGSMSSSQFSMTVSATKPENTCIPITSPQYLTAVSSSNPQMAASPIQQNTLSAVGTTTPRNPFPARVVKEVCKCFCRNLKRLHAITPETVGALKKHIRRELQVDKTNLSSLIQKKVSRPDARPSASAAGYLGLVLLCLPFLLIVFADAMTVTTALFSTTRAVPP
ncbi:uncharacterized protein [Haliotis cracherodii]|uniref:uncharacterized protein n=1 Tax=Haliotis cracherodii TaxID=6455 RepID=UPI0039EA7275